MNIFLDFDGTLTDISLRHYRVYREVTVQLGGTPVSKAKYWKLKRMKTKWAEILAVSNISPSLEADFLNIFIQKIEDPAYLELDELFPDTLSSLEKLSKIGDCYLVSLRRNHRNLIGELNRLNIERYFVEILTGHSDNDGYDVKMALIKDKSKGEPGVMIGDTEADIITGKMLGLRTIAVKSGIRDERFLEALHADDLVNGIKQVTALL